MPSHWSEYDLKGSVDKYGELAMAIISCLFNVYVFVYHAFNGPHPKHLLTRRSRISIGFHMLSGMLNVLIPIFCFFLDYEGKNYESCVYTLVALDVIHTSTALYQISGLFGMRFVMRPSYAAVILMKFAASIYWVLEHKSFSRLRMYYFLISIYGWVRIYFALFQWLRIFMSNLYSISVILAGLTCFPLAIGPWFNVVLLLLCGIYKVSYEYREYLAKAGRLSKSEIEIFMDETREKHRHIHLSDPIIRSALRWMGYLSLSHGSPENFKEKEQAMVVFDVIDENGDGVITFGELSELNRAFGQNQAKSRQMLKELRKKLHQEHLGFSDFFTHLKPVWSFVFAELLSEVRFQNIDALMSFDEGLPHKKLNLLHAKSSSEPVLPSKRQRENVYVSAADVELPAVELPVVKANTAANRAMGRNHVDPEAIEVSSPVSISIKDTSPSTSTYEIEKGSLPQTFYAQKKRQSRDRTSTIATAVESDTFESYPSLPEEVQKERLQRNRVPGSDYIIPHKKMSAIPRTSTIASALASETFQSLPSLPHEDRAHRNMQSMPRTSTIASALASEIFQSTPTENYAPLNIPRTSTIASALASDTFESSPYKEPHYGPVQMSDVDLNLASDWRRIDDDDTEEIVSPKKMLKDFRPDHSHKDQPTHVPVYKTPDGGNIDEERRLMGKLVQANEINNKSAPGYSQSELPDSMLNFWDTD